MSAHARDSGRRRYVCRREPGDLNCGSLTILADPLEETVAEMLFEAVDDEALRGAIASRPETDDGLAEAIRRDEASLEELSTDFYVTKLITREEFFAARTALVETLEANRVRFSQRTKSNVLAPFAGGNEVLRMAWTAGTLEWRRSIVGALLECVEILPGRPGRSPFDPARVRPIWRL